MADDSFLVEKISIAGPALASILQRFSSSPGDADGFLFGHFTRLPPPDPHDDDPSSSYSVAPGPGSPTAFSASITGQFSSGAPMSFYDSIGRIDPHCVRRATASTEIGHGSVLLGWFSCRRRTTLRPSMRELAVSNSLFKTLTLGTPSVPKLQDSPPAASIFLLLSSSSTENQSIHTHEYRAFVLRKKSPGGACVLEPTSLHIVNIGPDFRGQYGSFLPESMLPLMPCGAEDDLGWREGLRGLQEAGAAQRLLGLATEGFKMEQLAHLVGPGGAEYVSELEDLYRKMLLKLERLASLVEKSSAKVLEQENKNSKMRCRLAGLE
ncbi:hypothetical protein HPP92_019198 [Vanilla planifolia]|uniref:BRCA1-A complex subunit Abraxas n=1 Tax=Vanilla planifolia TaxID=51239 RepID=A0A835Q3L8_VANPL|nr:hypothetical protein HPP92_019707 [Vanilla planifolia]KAG0465034.1 hypothetical protein HPP92_019198 [Vanilla planifolia]